MSVKSLKMKHKFSVHKIPIARVKYHILSRVCWLEKMFYRYPRGGSDRLFSTKNYPQMSYLVFNKSLKNLIASAKIRGNYSTHSLRTGDTSSLRAAGVPLSYI